MFCGECHIGIIFLRVNHCPFISEKIIQLFGTGIILNFLNDLHTSSIYRKRGRSTWSWWNARASVSRPKAVRSGSIPRSTFASVLMVCGNDSHWTESSEGIERGEKDLLTHLHGEVLECLSLGLKPFRSRLRLLPVTFSFWSFSEFCNPFLTKRDLF